MAKLSTIIKAKAQLKAVQALTYIIPVQHPLVFAGSDSSLQLCQNIAQLGMKHVLIVTDHVLHGLGVIKPIETRLHENNVTVSVFTGVTPDPTTSVVEEAIDMFQRAQCDSVLAIGGGSAIDTAKVLALAVANQKTPQQLIGILKSRKSAVPLFVIPTTAGTGSEVTIAAVISDPMTHVKSLVVDPKIVPLSTALDPVIMQGMPPSITADTGIDALTHALESWISLFATQETDYYARTASKLIMENLLLAYQDGNNLKAREGMALGSHYAGLAMNKAAIGYVHAFAHQLGAKYHIPHGRANAIMLTHILQYNRDATEHRLAQLAREIGLISSSSNDANAAHTLIESIKALIQSLNITTQIPQLSPHDFPDMIQAAFKEAHGMYALPKYMDYTEAESLLRQLYN